MNAREGLLWGTMLVVVLVVGTIYMARKKGGHEVPAKAALHQEAGTADAQPTPPETEAQAPSTPLTPANMPLGAMPPSVQTSPAPPTEVAGQALEAAVASRASLDAGNTAEPPTHPPGFSEPEIPMTETAQLLNLVRKTLSDAGPQASEMGRNLLDAEDPKMRQLGAILLAEQADLDAASLQRVAADASPTVPLNTLGWILDSGGHDQANQLIGLLVGRGLQTDSLMGLLAGDELSESGSRAALELLNASLDAEAKADVFGTISEDAAYAYSVRMKATTLLRDTMAFEDYRNYVQTAEQDSGSQDARWQEGIERLSDSLDGPAQIHEGPAILTPSDIDEMLAREYPMILEDLAQRIEYVLSKEDAYIQPGTAARLAERVEELKNRPWASTQQISLRRLESAVKLLPEAEDTDTPPPPNYLPPPPGF